MAPAPAAGPPPQEVPPDSTAVDVAPPMARLISGRLFADEAGPPSTVASDDAGGDDWTDSDGDAWYSQAGKRLSDERFALQPAREIEVSGAEFEWLATGALPLPPPPPRQAGDCGTHTGGPDAPPRAGCTACEAAAAAAALRVAAKGRRTSVSSGGGAAGTAAFPTSTSWFARAKTSWAAARRAALRDRARKAATGPERRVLFDPVSESTATRAFRGISIFGLPLVHPNSLLSRLEGALVSFLDGTYSAFVVPIAIAFVGNEEWEYWSPWAMLDCAVGIVFTVDILFSFHRATIVRHNFRRRLLADGRLVARAYALHSHSVMDIITVVPFWVQVGLITLKYGGNPRLIDALFALRVLRLLRVLPVISQMFVLTSSDLGRSLVGVFSTAALYLTTMLYVVAVLVNLLACIWFFTARLEGGLKGATTWMSEVAVSGVPLPAAGPVNQYVASAYFAITTMTTVGYGDITAQTPAEMGVAAGFMLIGILFFGFLISSMGATLESSSTAARRGKALRAKFEEVEAWMGSRRLPAGLRRRILEYYSEVWVRASEWRERDLYRELPPTLRSEVTRTLALDVFRSSDIFCAAPEPLLHETASGMTPVSIFPGFDLCEQGEPADGLWVMHEGELLLLRDGVPVDVVKAPAIVGESAILADRVPEAGRRVVTMRAVELCTLWHLPGPRLTMLLERCPQISTAIEADFRGHIRKYAARAGGGGGGSPGGSAAHLAGGGGGGGGGEGGSGRGRGRGGGGGGGAEPTANTPRAGLIDLLARLEDAAARTGASGPDAAALRRNISLARGPHGRHHGPGSSGGASGAASLPTPSVPPPAPPPPPPRPSGDVASLLAAEDAEEFVELPPGGPPTAGGLGSRRPSAVSAGAVAADAGLDPLTATTAATMGSVRPNVFARLSGRWLPGGGNGGGGGGGGNGGTDRIASTLLQRSPSQPGERVAGGRARGAPGHPTASASDRLASSNVLVAEFARSLPRARVRHAARVSGSGVGGGGGGGLGRMSGRPPLARPSAGDPFDFETESLAEEMVRLASEAGGGGGGGAAAWPQGSRRSM